MWGIDDGLVSPWTSLSLCQPLTLPPVSERGSSMFLSPLVSNVRPPWSLFWIPLLRKELFFLPSSLHSFCAPDYLVYPMSPSVGQHPSPIPWGLWWGFELRIMILFLGLASRVPLTAGQRDWSSMGFSSRTGRIILWWSCGIWGRIHSWGWLGSCCFHPGFPSRDNKFYLRPQAWLIGSGC